MKIDVRQFDRNDESVNSIMAPAGIVPKFVKIIT